MEQSAGHWQDWISTEAGQNDFIDQQLPVSYLRGKPVLDCCLPASVAFRLLHLSIKIFTALLNARNKADRWARHVGVPIIDQVQLARFAEENDKRNLYLLDVRDPEEFALKHPAGFTSAPGGQLVQATDEWVSQHRAFKHGSSKFRC